MSRSEAMNRARAKWRANVNVMLAEATRCAWPVSNNTIMYAPVKPEGVSDVRWRIELARRRKAAYYAQFGEECK